MNKINRDRAIKANDDNKIIKTELSDSDKAHVKGLYDMYQSDARRYLEDNEDLFSARVTSCQIQLLIQLFGSSIFQ